jgi:hypothetical protein
MRILILLTAAVGLTAQVQGPQLGYAAYKGELRRIDGLSGSSRLSESILIGGYARIDVGSSSRWFLAATESETVLLDLSDSSTRVVQSAPFEKALWSAKGEAVVIDGAVVLSRFTDKDLVKRDVVGTILAVSDKGAVAVRDEERGSVSLDGEVVAEALGATAAAFDGDALLVVLDRRIARVEPGKSIAYLEIPVEISMLRAGSDGAVYACNKSQFLRIDSAGASLVFDMPVEASRFDLLSDGSVLISSPALEEPGWLFRWREGEGGAFFFVPGFPARGEVVAQ